MIIILYLFQTQVAFEGRIAEHQQTFKGGIKGLEIYSCIFAPDKRESSKTLVTILISFMDLFKNHFFTYFQLLRMFL